MPLCARPALSAIRFLFAMLTFKLRSKFTNNIILHCLSRPKSLAGTCFRPCNCFSLFWLLYFHSFPKYNSKGCFLTKKAF